MQQLNSGMSLTNSSEEHVKIFAWIHIKNPQFKLIQPLMYKMLDNFFGKGTLDSILDFKLEMQLDGYYSAPVDIDLNKHPFYGIGMVEFYNRFNEIFEYYAKKKKNKQQMYEHIVTNRDLIFVSSVPIYSAVLRDVFITNEEYSYMKIDKQYNALYGNCEKLNEEKEITNSNIAKINKNLYKAQNNLNQAWDLIFTSVNEKEGLNKIGPLASDSKCKISLIAGNPHVGNPQPSFVRRRFNDY